MQTFLPYPNFFHSLNCLDSKRLGKQRVEAFQIIKTLKKPNCWSNHPAVLMWGDYISALIIYYNMTISIWVSRGFNNTMKQFPCDNCALPPWLGDDRFHNSHKSNLLRKDSRYYGKFNWNIPINLPYFWPTKEGY